MPTFNSCTECVGSPGITHNCTRLFPRHECIDDLGTDGSFDSQVMWAIDVLGLFVGMLSMGVCTTRH